MVEPESDKQRTTPYLDFRRSRLYFGTRFWIAIALAVISILASMAVEADTSLGRAVLAVVALVGVVVGVLLQPSPKPEDHKPRARQAIQNLSTSNQLLDDVKTVAGQLDEQESEQRTKIGLVNMSQDLTRAQQHLIYSMAEWDQIAPGAVSEFRSAQVRGYQILRELSDEEGVENE